MPLPFLALAPQEPRVIEVPYQAVTLPCVNQEDVTDSTDVTDGGEGDEV